MRVLTCAATRRRLHAFHDEELVPLSAQIAVGAHLEWCDDCASAFAELRFLRAALRAATPGRRALTSEEAASLQTDVVNRVKARQTASFVRRMHEVFEDVHLVCARLGGAAATIAGVVIVLSMMRFATSERPDSPTALANVLAPPGSNENPVTVDGRVRMPRALDQAFSTTSSVRAEEDAVFTLAAEVTREGRIASLELLHSNSGQSVAPGSDEAKLAESLMDAVSQARFEPAQVGGLPVAVNMVWLVAHTTVRASKRTLDLPALPNAKKRAASLRPTFPSRLVVS